MGPAKESRGADGPHAEPDGMDDVCRDRRLGIVSAGCGVAVRGGENDDERM